MKNVLTTGQIAKKLCVAPRTVQKWIDSGLLRGYQDSKQQNQKGSAL